MHDSPSLRVGEGGTVAGSTSSFSVENKRSLKRDGSAALDDPCKEAFARYLAMPKELREFNSLTELCEHFSVGRSTLRQWMEDDDVLRRFEWLVARYKRLITLVLEREYPDIAAAQIRKAKTGNTAAANFCRDALFRPEERPSNGSKVDPDMSVNYLFEQGDEIEIVLPTGIRPDPGLSDDE